MRVVFANAFGRQVAETLHSRRGATRTEWNPLDPDDDPLRSWDGEFIAFALGRPYPNASRRLSSELTGRRVRWSAAVIRDRYLFCGPLHKPGAGACWDCFQRRSLALAIPPRSPEREQALDGAYNQTSGEMLSSFLPPTVLMAASMLSVHADEADDLPPGALTACDLLEGSVVSTRVVPLHGCACRGERAHTQDDRFTSRLIDCLKEEDQ